MNSILRSLLTLCVLFSVYELSTAFSTVSPVNTKVSTAAGIVPRIATTSLYVFGKKKTAAQKAEEEAKASKYWQGEWVCKDCGYIYNRVRCY
jgi:rubrerythrin